MNILFLNVGRRCELVKCFKKALNERGGGFIFGSDITPLAPGLQVTDFSEIFPLGDSKEFDTYIIDFCKKNKIDLVIPTIDPDLIRLDRIRPMFNNEINSSRLLISPTFTLRKARSKRLSKRLFIDLGAEVPKYINTKKTIKFPVHVKPDFGSAGVGSCVVNDSKVLSSLLKENPDLMVEEIIYGPEYTVDVLCDFSGKAIIAIPRKRIKVREGEVLQGVIERNEELEQLSIKIAEGFKATGPINIQFRKKNDNTFIAMEVNARMGGGLPLSIAAGADFPGWILDMCLNKSPNLQVRINDGIFMSRYDNSFFLCKQKIEKLSDKKYNYNFDSNDEKLLADKLKAMETWLFDLDDTLYPEIDFVFSGYRAVSIKVFEDFSIDIESDLRQNFFNGYHKDVFKITLNNFRVAVNEKYIKALVKIYREHMPVIRPYVDVVPFLKHLKSKSIKTGLITDGIVNVQKNKLESLKIRKYFDSVIFTAALAGRNSWKPSSKAYLKCLSKLDTNPECSLYIGDNPLKDFKAPNKLGMTSIRLRRVGGLHYKEENIDYEGQAFCTFKSLSDIKKIIDVCD